MAQPRKGTGEQLSEMLRCRLWPAVATVKQQHLEYSGVEIVGDFRRGSELVTDLALAAETKKPSGSEETSRGLTLAVTDKKHYGASLLHATGSAEHLKQLAELAHDKGLELRPDGLYRGRKLIASATEKDIYEARGLQFLERELREGRDEIARAARHKLPKLVSDNDLHGILHCHTTHPMAPRRLRLWLTPRLRPPE